MPPEIVSHSATLGNSSLVCHSPGEWRSGPQNQAAGACPVTPEPANRRIDTMTSKGPSSYAMGWASLPHGEHRDYELEPWVVHLSRQLELKTEKATLGTI